MGATSTSEASSPSPEPVSYSINPFELDLIVAKVLEFTDHRSTLNCRRVNHQWNNKALKFLRRQKARLELNSGNIAEYLRLVEATGQKSPNLKLSLQVGRTGGAESYESQKALLLGVNQLFQLFGGGKTHQVSFVESLSLTSSYHVELDWGAVGFLLKRISPGLLELVIKEGVFNQNIGFFFLDETVAFPELRSLSYAAILKNANLLPQIVNAAPKLTRLEVIMEPLERHNPSAYQHRNHNLAQAFNKIAEAEVNSRLTDLATVLDSRETYEALRRIRFGGLTTLMLTININPDDESFAVLGRFLAESCPNLNALHFTFVQSVDRVVVFPVDQLISEFPAQLPRLPKVRHFGYGVNRMPLPTNGPAMVRFDSLNFSPQHFPALHSATVKFGAFVFAPSPQNFPLPGQWAAFLPGHAPVIDWYGNRAFINNVAFPNVTFLRLYVEDLDGLFCDGRLFGYPTVTARDACNQLHLLYPNVRSLRLEVELRPTQEMVDKLRIVARHLFQELAGLEELEICSNCVNFLPRILTAQNAACQPRLRELRIPQTGKDAQELMARPGGATAGSGGCPHARQAHGPVEDRPPELNIVTILEWFPNLKRVTLQQKFVQFENLAELGLKPKVTITVI